MKISTGVNNNVSMESEAARKDFERQEFFKECMKKIHDAYLDINDELRQYKKSKTFPRDVLFFEMIDTHARLYSILKKQGWMVRYEM